MIARNLSDGIIVASESRDKTTLCSWCGIIRNFTRNNKTSAKSIFSAHSYNPGLAQIELSALS